jgi:hypothetical protein
MFYALHKESTDVFKYWDKSLIHKPLQVEIVEENNHHWVFTHKNERFMVCKYPLKERFKSIPPFKTREEALDYLNADIPTFDKEGHRI